MDKCVQWDKKKFVSYLIWSFSIAWVLQVIASILALRGNSMAFTLILSVCMFAPFLTAVLSRIPLRTLGWKPKFKGNIKYMLMAWFGPLVFTVLGALLYFVIFPDSLDLTGEYLKVTYGEIILSQLAEQGITIPLLILVSVMQAATYAPLLNMFVALGEEVGWRGVMQPMLNDKLGRTKGLIVGGVIWGVWHWPVIILAGYEYGFDYVGAPVLGPVLFCLITVVMGTLLYAVYEKTECIWVPALAHGAINATASIPLLVLNPEYANNLTVGPLPIGIIAVLPALVVTVWILFKKKSF